MKRVVTGTLLVAGFAVTATSAGAAPVPAPAPKTSATSEADAVTPALKAEATATIKQLGAMAASGNTTDANLARIGLQRVSGKTMPVAQPATPAAWSMARPSVVYNRKQNVYYTYADWKRTGRLEGPVGDPDGVGVAYSRSVRDIKADVYACMKTKKPVCKWTGAPETTSDRVIGWTVQDRIYPGNLTSVDYGRLVHAWRPRSNQCTQIWSKWGHDWSTTQVSGFSVSSTGLGISWSSSTHRWVRASNGAYGYHC